MKKPFSRWGCLVGGSLIMLLLLAGGGWLFFRSQNSAANSSPSSQVLVFILSPTSGDELKAGDFVPIAVQAVAPETIIDTEFFVDGQSMGVVTDEPQNASWTWQALSPGIHTLSARATSADGQVGQSQTVIVNVLTRDNLMKIPAEEGQTLEQIGAGFGVSPDQMADANPHVDPTQPLPEGQSVQVPVGGAGAGNGSGNGGGATQPENGEAINEFIPILINWQFESKEPVDKSYCYTSTGDGNWRKMPKNPFDFFNGGPVNYPQYDFALNGEADIIQAQCWGWLGGVLKFLGEGEAEFDILQPPGELMINGDGFVLLGMPQYKPPLLNPTGGQTKTIPPPFAVRESSDTADCTQHFGNIFAAFLCDALLNAQIKQYIILEWEWQPKVNWPASDTWLSEIDGYRIYEIDPFTNDQKYLQKVDNPNQKVTAVPMPWGGEKCYGVQAYVDDPAIESSAMVTYCPGEIPAPQIITLYPTDWLTTGGSWAAYGDCAAYGTGIPDAFPDGMVLVGSFIVDDGEDDCFNRGAFSAAVKFGHPVLPPGALLQKAGLRFSSTVDYKATAFAGPKPTSCVGEVRKAIQDWTALGGNKNFVGSDTWYTILNGTPFATVSGYTIPDVDVTSAVKSWIKNPEQNHGFILIPVNAPYPVEDGFGVCRSTLENFQLEIYYFAP